MYKIENAKQYLRTIGLLKQFEEAVDRLNEPPECESLRNQLMSACYTNQIEDFKLQLAKYKSSIKP